MANISWKDAIAACRHDMTAMNMESDDLDVIEQFCEAADGEDPDLSENWTVEDVDIALANFKKDYGDNDPEAFNVIANAVISFEDLLV